MSTIKETEEDRVYLEWEKGLDRLFTATVGVSIHDVQDFCWRDAWEDGCSHKDAIAQFVEEYSEFEEIFEEMLSA